MPHHLQASEFWERETGLEPATFSLEGLGLYAVWRASRPGMHFVSSYGVVDLRSLTRW